jgi:hypothetical protein
MKRNTWQSRFGAQRRALDRKTLQEAERAIATEEASQRPPVARETPLDARKAIARAFGRPLDLWDR